MIEVLGLEMHLKQAMRVKKLNRVKLETKQVQLFVKKSV
jgi:hypothetical protein